MSTPPLALPAVPRIFWWRSIAWLLLLGPFFFLSYGTANRLAAEAGTAPSLFFEWERHIPFLPWTIVPYWSIDLLYGLSFLCCRSRLAVDRHALRLLSVQLLSVACFLLFPLRFAFERPPSEGLFGMLFDALTSFDQPYNQAPSLHIGLLVLVWVQFARLPAGAAAKALIHGWALLIGLSVLTTWQHHFIDVPTGLAAGLFCLWLWPEAEDLRPPLSRPLSRSPRRWRIAACYAGSAAMLLALSLAAGGGWLWLAWPALALLLVALNYAVAGVEGFQKRDGRLSLAATWLMAPYLAGAWINSRLWTRNAPAPSEIADGVWLGRFPTARDLRRGGFAAFCDFSAELPAPAGPWRYAGHPWLDLMPPTPAQLAAAARTIENVRAAGKTLVACALGCSRSAAAVAAWLVWSDRAASVKEAVERLRSARPQIVLDADTLAALEAFAGAAGEEKHAA